MMEKTKTGKDQRTVVLTKHWATHFLNGVIREAHIENVKL